MVDAHLYRPNVGIIISNSTQDRVLWARRIGEGNKWQFPQGGIDDGESIEEALFRELFEEAGLRSAEVQIVASTNHWYRYRLPHKVRHRLKGYLGQNQKWFLLRMMTEDSRIKLDASQSPEFDSWRWVSFWYPLNQVAYFKRDVYRQALLELAPHFGSAIGGDQKQRPEC